MLRFLKNTDWVAGGAFRAEGRVNAKTRRKVRLRHLNKFSLNVVSKELSVTGRGQGH